MKIGFRASAQNWYALGVRCSPSYVMPTSRLFLLAASCAGVLAVVTLEAGWVVAEVGRQPWIVYDLMKVEDAATANQGVWLTFVCVVILYVALGATMILVLRGMSQRFRRAGGFVEHDTPYGPGAPTESASSVEETAR